MNFVADFGAKNEGRLSPFEFDKPKDAENSPFEASSALVVKAIDNFKTLCYNYFAEFSGMQTIADILKESDLCISRISAKCNVPIKRDNNRRNLICKIQKCQQGHW